jgi:uncharacterized protein (DUF1330 family)
MKRFLVPFLTMFIGSAIGAFALQELHAQTRMKAYTVTEIEVLDAPATAEFRKLVVPAIQAAGGRFLNTAGGKVSGIIGAAPPQRVALTEWDSAGQARAFYMSKAWADLSPERDKAEKLIRVYSVEVVN